ncbi:MAG: ABC transporter permease [Ignavibacteriales bacterium]|nr:ABC transporter permease [Ignavibacteriales bacterium]
MRGKVWGFFRRDLLNDLSSRFSLILQLLNVALTVGAYVFLSRLILNETLSQWYPNGEGYFPFVLVGMATNGAMLTAMTGLSRSLQLQQPSGVLKPLFFSQTDSTAVLFLSSIYPFVRAVVDLFIYLIIGWALSDLNFARANVVGAGLIMSLSIVAFCSLGLLAAAFTVLFKFGNPFLWVIGSSSWFLGGVLYPLHLFPLPLRWLAEIFPLTHALRGMRAALLADSPLTELLVPLMFLTAFSIILIPAGVVVFHIGLRRARINGLLNEW